MKADWISQCFPMLLLFVYSYSRYYFLSNSNRLRRLLTRSLKDESKSVVWTLFQRGIGVFFLGVFPACAAVTLFSIDLKEYGLGGFFSWRAGLWSFSIGMGIILLNSFTAERQTERQDIPAFQVKEWTIVITLLNTLSWLAYLLAYEFLFRGFLLFSSLNFLGMWPAIFINIVFYSVVHLPKGWQQTLGALPFGLVLCLLTLETGSIWTAFIIHGALAISFDHFSLKANQKMQYSFSPSP
jgi:membrane protease YdiL (CAAX protease family)